MRPILLICVMALPLAGCAAQPSILPGKILEVKAHPLPPYQMHEECATLKAGDVLEYNYAAQAPLDFNIHYHEGKAVIIPLSRDKLRADRGDFKVLVDQEYCLMWEAGAGGTPLDYSVRLIRGAK